jgi:ferritin-like metal-binding protein YciE
METQEHDRYVGERLEAYGESPSKLKDAASRAGAVGLGLGAQAAPDTPGRLAAVAYAFEHLEIASYEQLKRVAQRVGDEATVRVTERILADERLAAEKLANAWDLAVERSLEGEAAAS